MRKQLGTAAIGLGVLLICCALGLTIHNLWQEQAAGDTARETMESIELLLPESQEQKEMTPLPAYQIDPNISMPEQTIDGIGYIGYLSIPALGLELPVITETTRAYLQVAPCRFTGSAYLDDLVIGAHNYSTHFGRLQELAYGDEIAFTDMDGNVFLYEVADLEVLNPDQDEDLCSGEYPLSLYTCTIGGRTRLTVRCATLRN